MIPDRFYCTTEEREELRAALAERLYISDVANRDLIVPPPVAADVSWEGGLRYGFAKVWQDQPALVFYGSLALLLALVLK